MLCMYEGEIFKYKNYCLKIMSLNFGRLVSHLDIFQSYIHCYTVPSEKQYIIRFHRNQSIMQ